MLAWYMLSSCVCVSVCMPLCHTGIVSEWPKLGLHKHYHTKMLAKFKWGHPHWGHQMHVGRLKSATFDTQLRYIHPFYSPLDFVQDYLGEPIPEPIWILLKQKTVSGSGISLAICKFAPCPRQITMPAPHHSNNLL